MKLLASLIFLLISFSSSAQELNLGINLGTDLGGWRTGLFSVGPSLEFTPKMSIFSINTEVNYWNYNNQNAIMIPLYLRFFLGKKIRIGSSVGGFLKSNNHYGWLAGVNFDTRLSNRLRLFAKTEAIFEKWKYDSYDKWGKPIELHDGMFYLTVCFGIKYNILE